MPMSLHAKKNIRSLYPECTDREVEDLIAAIKSDKYWSGLPGRRDLIYVVALTKAKIPVEGGFQARVTHLKNVIVSHKAARFCRHGVILASLNIGGCYIANTVLTWPAFLKVMRGKTEEAYRLLLNPETAPPYLDVKSVANPLVEGMLCCAIDALYDFLYQIPLLTTISATNDVESVETKIDKNQKLCRATQHC